MAAQVAPPLPEVPQGRRQTQEPRKARCTPEEQRGRGALPDRAIHNHSKPPPSNAQIFSSLCTASHHTSTERLPQHVALSCGYTAFVAPILCLQRGGLGEAPRLRGRPTSITRPLTNFVKESRNENAPKTATRQQHSARSFKARISPHPGRGSRVLVVAASGRSAPPPPPFPNSPAAWIPKSAPLASLVCEARKGSACIGS